MCFTQDYNRFCIYLEEHAQSLKPQSISDCTAVDCKDILFNLIRIVYGYIISMDAQCIGFSLS